MLSGFMWGRYCVVSCATSHSPDRTRSTKTTFTPSGKALWSPVRFIPFEIFSDCLLTRICLVFPYIAEDGSVKQQLSSTHVDCLESYDISYLTLPTAYYTPFWEENSLLEKLSLQECGHQTLCGDYCRDGRPDCMVYLAHRDCWKVAFSSHRWSSLDWSRLAVQTRPFEIRSWRQEDQIVLCHDDPVTPILGSVAPDSSLFYEGTPLGSLLARVRTLPTELQFQIMGLLRGTMMASLLQTKIFVSELLPFLRSESTWAMQPKPEALQVAGDESSGILSCRSTSIMGRHYLRDLTLGRPKGSGSHIPIAKQAVRGVQFALGRCGLRGIRISYEDGSSSPWLGESSSCWIGAVRCCDLSRLKVVADVSCHCIPIRRWDFLCQNLNRINVKSEVAGTDVVA